MHVDTATLNLAVGVLVSLLVPLLTHVKAPEPVKFAIGFLLSGVGGVVTQLTTGHASLYPTLLSFGETWVVAVTVHEHLLSPTGVQALLHGIGLQAGEPTPPADSLNPSPVGDAAP